MAPLSRFSDRAADYAKYRPSYPVAAIAAILDELGNPSELMAADIGAGTGISARLLAERGVQVLAIEPNAAMRQAAAPHPLVEFREATAEQTNLPDASIDLVISCQAFHWFDPRLSLPEFHRILKPSGRLALVWNERDESDVFTADYSHLIRKMSDDHPAEKRLDSVKPLLASSHFVHVHRHIFTSRQALDLSGLIGRVQSVSYLPREGAAYQQLVSGLQELYDRWADDRGLIYLVYCTSVYLAEPTS
jgi:SAM-dependent methyltransferase